MALTGFYHPDGRAQLECDVKPTWWCKRGFHRRKKENFGTDEDPVWMKRCIHCNNLKLTRKSIRWANKKWKESGICR